MSSRKRLLRIQSISTTALKISDSHIKSNYHIPQPNKPNQTNQIKSNQIPTLMNMPRQNAQAAIQTTISERICPVCLQQYDGQGIRCTKCAGSILAWAFDQSYTSSKSSERLEGKTMFRWRGLKWNLAGIWHWAINMRSGWVGIHFRGGIF